MSNRWTCKSVLRNVERNQFSTSRPRAHCPCLIIGTHPQTPPRTWTPTTVVNAMGHRHHQTP